MGKTLGDADDPLLVSVRSGREVLDARHDGHRPQPRPQRRVACDGLAKQAGNERFAWDSYRRLHPDVRQDRARHRRRAASSTRSTSVKQRQGHRRTTSTSTPTDLQQLVDDVQGRSSASTPAASSRRTRASSWTSPIHAVFDSWNADRAMLYRRQERIPDDLGTAVNVVAMVFGNLGADSGTGVAFTRDPATGRPGRLRRLPAERAGRGRRRRHPQHRAAGRPREHRQARLRRAARHHGDAREALPRPVRHRVHHRARQALDAADPRRQAHRRRGVPRSPPSSSTRASSTWTRRCSGSPARSSPS